MARPLPLFADPYARGLLSSAPTVHRVEPSNSWSTPVTSWSPRGPGFATGFTRFSWRSLRATATRRVRSTPRRLWSPCDASPCMPEVSIRSVQLALAAVRRLRAITCDTDALETEMTTAVAARQATNLLAICGVGPIVAAKILGETRGVERFRTAAAYAAHTGTAPLPASSGQTNRHRLNRGGNRQLNRALFTIAMVQARWNPDAVVYLARRRAEGKSPAEARRCLKRHLATVVYRAMQDDAVEALLRLHSAAA